MDPHPDDSSWSGQLRFWTHDLINTACGIRELVGLIDRDGGDREAHDLLGLAAARLIEELRALHALVDREPGGFIPLRREIALDRMLREVQACCAGLAGSTGRHLRIVDPPSGCLCTDPDLLRRALVNLVRNALEATSAGGTVTIAVETDASEIRFAVHNPGQAPPYLDPAFRAASDKGEGHGLGLHGAGTIIQRHLGGELRLVSDRTHGTTCTIVLPRRLRVRDGTDPYDRLARAAG